MTTEGPNYGQVIGSGKDRVYVTREGDTLEAIAAYFYGDAQHTQRLRADNPALDRWEQGAPLPAGFRMNVPVDPARGDTA